MIPHRQFLGTLCRANLQAPKLVPRYVQGEGKSSAHSLAQHTPRPVFQTTLNPDTEERRAEGVCVDDTAATPDRVHVSTFPEAPCCTRGRCPAKSFQQDRSGTRGGGSPRCLAGAKSKLTSWAAASQGSWRSGWGPFSRLGGGREPPHRRDSGRRPGQPRLPGLLGRSPRCAWRVAPAEHVSQTSRPLGLGACAGASPGHSCSLLLSCPGPHAARPRFSVGLLGPQFPLPGLLPPPKL